MSYSFPDFPDSFPDYGANSATDAPAFPSFPTDVIDPKTPTTIKDVLDKYFKDDPAYSCGEPGVCIIPANITSHRPPVAGIFSPADNVDAALTIVISDKGTKLLLAYQDCKPLLSPDEVVVFIEDNARDLGKNTVRRMLVGERAASKVLDGASSAGIAGAVNAIADHLLTTADVEALFEAVRDGSSMWAWVGLALIRTVIIVDQPFLQAAIDGCNQISGFITGLLRIPEKIWNPARAEPTASPQPQTAKDALEQIKERIQGLMPEQSTAKPPATPPGQKSVMPVKVPVSQGKKTQSAAAKLPEMGTVKGIAEKIYGTLEAMLKIETEYAFALVCGFWNSFVDLIASIFDLIGIVMKLLLADIKVIKDPVFYYQLIMEFQDELTQYLVKLNWDELFLQFILFDARVVDYVQNKLPKVLPALLSPANVGYCIGYIGFLVVDFFIPIVDLTLIARFTRLLATGAEEVMGAVMAIARRLFGKALEVAELELGIVMKAISATLAKLSEGAKGIREIFEDMWQAFVEWIEKGLGIKPRAKDLSVEDIDWLEKKPTTGNLGGKILKDSQIRKLKGYLSEHGIELIQERKAIFKKSYRDLFYSMRMEGKVGGFNAATKEFYLTKDATEIIAFHEQCHVKHWVEVGEETYAGLSKLEKETYVWEQILRNRSQWTEAELNDALRYVNIPRGKAGLKPIKL